MIKLAIVVVISLVFIIILMCALYVQCGISSELELRNKNLKNRVDILYRENQSLKYNLKFEKTISKTFSDGLEALTKNKK